MEAYVMMQAGGIKKYLVIVDESAYETYGNLQNVEHALFDSWHVSTFQVNIDLDEIERVYLVDRDGIHLISEKEVD